MNYRQLVAHHLQSLRARGYDNQQIADMLGYDKKNNISMLMSSTETTVMAAKKLPALVKACGLNDYEAYRLLFRLAMHNCATEWDGELFAWQAKLQQGAIAIYRARVAAAASISTAA